MRVRHLLFSLLGVACAPSAATPPGSPSTAAPTAPSAGSTASSAAQAGEQSEVRPPAVPVAGERARFDALGARLVFVVGTAGAHDLALQDLTTGAVSPVAAPGDDIDPTWTPDGRVVFSSNRGGGYDLWLLDPKSQVVEQVTKFEGDELEASVAPIPFGFYAVQNGSCGSAASGVLLDAYHKVAFVRKNATTREVWFASLGVRAVPSEFDLEDYALENVQLSAHATHKGRISKAGAQCSDPRFSPDGLTLAWTCDGAIEEAPAKFSPTFQAAFDALKGEASPECGEQFDMAKCRKSLKRVYARYPGAAVSTPDSQLARPEFSKNQTLLLADANGKPMQLPRYGKARQWAPLPIGAQQAAHLSWSPSGSEVAFEVAGQVQRVSTNFYLQTVGNALAFPELLGDGQSQLLSEHRFLVRPAKHKEFYVLHDQLRYAQKPQFISADVILQAFRDEFLRLLQKGERAAAHSVHLLTRELMDYYVGRAAKGGANAARDHYLAVLFATAWVPLEAAGDLYNKEGDAPSRMSPDDYEAAMRGELATPPTLASRLPQLTQPVLQRVNAKIQKDVEGNLKAMFAHQGIVDVTVPGRDKPLKVDFSQFAIRGAYAENDLAPYFLSMNWLSMLPIPIDADLRLLVDKLDGTKLEGSSAYAQWQRVSALVGSFMGRPVDATVEHVREELKATKVFDQASFERALLKRRGPVPIRDADNRERELMLTLFPKRVGLDVTFFRQLTYPAVERGMPSSLDVFAVLGNARAAVHAAAEAGKVAARYRELLNALVKSTAETEVGRGYANTDLYHGWLAMLVTLATPPQLPADSKLAFARNNAWHDKQLYSALAGYTQLKHSAVLYAMQDMSAECGDETSFYIAVEMPVIPRPRGFVEPNVAFFDGLAALAERAYTQLYGDVKGPTASLWQSEGEPNLNALNLARDMAKIARTEVSGKPLSKEQADLIEYIGGKLESLTLGVPKSSTSIALEGAGREQRGVALTTDIHTNTQRQSVLALGVGRIFDLWVVTPSDVGETLTQGGSLSFYEYTAPMSERPTDAAWNERIEAGKAPPRPGWTKSFIEGK